MSRWIERFQLIVRGGNEISRDQVEFEADKFAVYFLLPAKLVRAEFESRFLTRKFELNLDAAFALGKHKFISQKNPRRTLCRELSEAIQFNGKCFVSMAERFGDATETMAIRLEELNFIG